MGVKTHLSSYPAEALGGLTLGVTPLEMSDVYATLADGGWRNAPIAITKVVFPDGHVDRAWGTPHRTKVLSEGVTAEETSILHQNVLGGTATRSAINCPTAAKTGTTSELVDAWLDGYTPNYSTVVWMGYPTRRVSMTDVHGEPQQGGYLPAEIWHAYMAAVTEGKPCTEFPTPKEAISYQPFFGRFASTGRSSGNENESESTNGEPSEKGKAKKPTERGPGQTGAKAEPEATIPRAHEPHEPHEPAAAPPVEKHGPEPAPTGGAEPHP
jgi:membrane peptidoglycan carboxypeptidase